MENSQKVVFEVEQPQQAEQQERKIGYVEAIDDKTFKLSNGEIVRTHATHTPQYKYGGELNSTRFIRTEFNLTFENVNELQKSGFKEYSDLIARVNKAYGTQEDYNKKAFHVALKQHFKLSFLESEKMFLRKLEAREQQKPQATNSDDAKLKVYVKAISKALDSGSVNAENFEQRLALFVKKQNVSKEHYAKLTQMFRVEQKQEQEITF